METGGDAVLDRGVGEQVAGEGADGEFVEGQVVVERTDEPVAPRPDLATIILLVALGVGVAGEIEPQRGPALAEVGRGEETIDGLLWGFETGAESGAFGVGGRKTGQIERHPAEPLRRVGWGRRLETFLFESMQDEAVDVGAHPGRVLDGGQWRLPGRDEGPVLAPLGALGDPLAERGDLGFIEGAALAVLGGGHAVLVAVGQEDAVEEFRFAGLAGDDGGFAGLAGGEGLVALGEGDVAGLFDAAVAGGAVLVEDGADVAVEVDGGGGGGAGTDGEGDGRGQRGRKGEQGRLHGRGGGWTAGQARIPFTTSEGLVTLVTRWSSPWNG